MPYPRNSLPVSDSDLQNLRESGLTDKTIHENWIRTEIDRLNFSYPNLAGEVNGRFRSRLHHPIKTEDGHTLRYLHPKGETSWGYYPAASLPRLRDKKQPVYITEGEKKALGLSQLGLAAIGLGGIWNWKIKGTDGLIPDIEQIDCSGRVFYIVFDYDETQKKRAHTRASAIRLADALKKAGAKEVYFIELPPGSGGSKQGIDDFLVAHGANGPAAFQKLVSKAKPIGRQQIKKVTPLQAMLRRKLKGTDEIEIGSADATDNDKPVIGSTMSAAAILVAGIRFLLRGWIPYGMLTCVMAEPGIGKSAFVLWLVRTILIGCKWFNGLPGPKNPGHVLWCATENDMAITLQRLRDWNIPMDNIVLPFEDDPLKSVNLTNQEHLVLIEKLIKHYKIKFVVIDSLRGAHGGDENNSQVGQVLQSLSQIAEKTNAAIVVVHHTKKLQVDEEITANSSRGSNAIFANFRSQIGIDRPDPKSKWCRVRVLKENLGIAPNPIGFLVTSKGLEFGAAPERPHRATEKTKAADWLRKRMKKGMTYKAGALFEEAHHEAGISERTLRRAAIDELKIVPKCLRKDNKIEASLWKLP